MCFWAHSVSQTTKGKPLRLEVNDHGATPLLNSWRTGHNRRSSCLAHYSNCSHLSRDCSVNHRCCSGTRQHQHKKLPLCNWQHVNEHCQLLANGILYSNVFKVFTPLAGNQTILLHTKHSLDRVYSGIFFTSFILFSKSIKIACLASGCDQPP